MKLVEKILKGKIEQRERWLANLERSHERAKATKKFNSKWSREKTMRFNRRWMKKNKEEIAELEEALQILLSHKSKKA